MQQLLVRLALLAIHVVCAYHAFRLPNPTPLKKDREKYRSRNKTFVGEHGFEIAHAVTALRYMTWAVNVLELTSLVTTFTFPSLVPSLSIPFHKLETGSTQLLAGPIVFAAGTFIRISTYRHLGRFFTIQLAVSEGHKLVTDGPYSIVRHPAYTGGIMVLLGNAWSQLGPVSIWTLVGMWRNPAARCFGLVELGVTGYIGIVSLLRVGKEDQVLRAEFKEQWESWARQTPYKLIPFIY